MGYLRQLVDYWRTTFDWRAQEEHLNGFEHFRTGIDGQSIHFIHARSPHDDALPLLLAHGWPGSVVEFLDVIPRLTVPKPTAVGPGTPSTWWRPPCRGTASPSRPVRQDGTWGASPAPSST